MPADRRAAGDRRMIIPVMRKLWARTIVFVFLLPLLAACGLTQAQRRSLKEFGSATTSLAHLSGQELRTYRQDVIEMKTWLFALENKQAPPPGADTPVQYQQRLRKDFDFDSGLDADNLQVRLDALDCLAQYGQLLAEFASRKDLEKMDEQARQFGRSLGRLPQDVLDESQAKGLSDLFGVAGRTWADIYKKQTLRHVVPKARPVVERLCDYLERDLDPKQPGFAYNVALVSDRLRRAAVERLKSDTAQSAERAGHVRALRMAYEVEVRLETGSARALEAIALLRKANLQMEKRLQADMGLDKDDIRQYYESVQNLASALRPFL
jgi:hypothetical protein